MRFSAMHDPVRAAFELREQLASEKRRLGFFLGAGTSMSVGLPGIDDLTSEIEKSLSEDFKARLLRIRSALGDKSNIEDVLNRVRLYRELGHTEDTATAGGLSAVSAAALDSAICRSIHRAVRIDPPRDLKPHIALAKWLHALHGNRDYPVEIFTTNYDVLLERTMEAMGVPFFDGFVGSVAPFFAPETVEADGTRGTEPFHPPRSWTRLWKIHGSIGWRMRRGGVGEPARITRLTDCEVGEGEELMIFPSREKYADSRKLPFLTYQDRLRKFLSTGEALLLVVGYSFSDDHLNEMIFQGLRSNSRLAVTVLAYGIEADRGGRGRLVLQDNLVNFGRRYRNLTVYGPDAACLGCVAGVWGKPARRGKNAEPWPFWDECEQCFTLGDFNAFASYLEQFMGSRVVPREDESDSSEAVRVAGGVGE